MKNGVIVHIDKVTSWMGLITCPYCYETQFFEIHSNDELHKWKCEKCEEEFTINASENL